MLLGESDMLMVTADVSPPVGRPAGIIFHRIEIVLNKPRLICA